MINFEVQQSISHQSNRIYCSSEGRAFSTRRVSASVRCWPDSRIWSMSSSWIPFDVDKNTSFAPWLQVKEMIWSYRTISITSSLERAAFPCNRPYFSPSRDFLLAGSPAYQDGASTLLAPQSFPPQSLLLPIGRCLPSSSDQFDAHDLQPANPSICHRPSMFTWGFQSLS